MVTKTSPGGQTSFVTRHASKVGKVFLGLLILTHGARAWAFSTWQGHEGDCIGATGLCVAYLFTTLVYWRQGWSGLMAFSMTNTGLCSMLQVVFPEASGYLGLLVAEVQICVMGFIAVNNLVKR